MSNTIRLKADETALFANLRNAFSKASVYGELIQNARRSGATAIAVTFDGSSLSVLDNGPGIADLQQLLTKATSGWNQDIVDDESPFGLGFLAALYACDQISVTTRTADEAVGRYFTATTEHILAGHEICFVPSTETLVEAGTKITLWYGEVEESEEARAKRVMAMQATLQRLVAGFPVPVQFNGALLARPHAITPESEGDFRNTEVGLIRIDLESRSYGMYLQGLPIEDTYGRSRGTTTVHLNNRFKAKGPDRTHLVDGGQQRDVPQAVEKAAWDVLKDRKASMGPMEFLLKHHAHCRSWNARFLLEDIPFALGEWFVDWTNQRPGHVNGDWEQADLDGVYTKEEVLAAGVVAMPEEEDTAAQVWVSASSRFTLRADAPVTEGHWLSQCALVVTDQELSVAIDGKGEERQVLLGGTDTVFSVATTIRVSHRASEETHDVQGLVVVDPERSWVKHMTVTGEAAVRDCIRLVSSYTDECDRWDEGEEDRDIEMLERLVEDLTTSSLTDKLVLWISRKAQTEPGTFAGKSFSVSFDMNGVPTAIAC